MKLLFDQNLAPALVARLADVFPDSSHVFEIGLDRADDLEVWNYAGENGFVLVSKDADFSDLSALHGHPPKLLWLQIGNCTTRQIEVLLRDNHAAIEQLAADENLSVLLLG